MAEGDVRPFTPVKVELCNRSSVWGVLWPNEAQV